RRPGLANAGPAVGQPRVAERVPNGTRLSCRGARRTRAAERHARRRGGSTDLVRAEAHGLCCARAAARLLRPWHGTHHEDPSPSTLVARGVPHPAGNARLASAASATMA